MATHSRKVSAPLTFDLPLSLIAKIGACRRGHSFKTSSEVVRLAIGEFNYDKFESSSEEHRQISVRLPADQKNKLTKVSRKKKVSVGELLRVAIDCLEAKASKKTAKGGRK